MIVKKEGNKKVIYLILLSLILVSIAEAVLVPMDIEGGVSEISIVEHERQVYDGAPTVVCPDCDNGTITIERNLRLYTVDDEKGNKKKMSLITVDVKNSGGKDIKDFSIIEYIPKSIASKMNEVIFTLQPVKIEERPTNIAVTWMFKNLAAKGVVNVGYIINKEVSGEIASNYSPIGKIANYAKESEGVSQEEADENKKLNIFPLFKYAIISIIVLILFAVPAYYLITKNSKRRQEKYDEQRERLFSIKGDLKKKGFKIKDISIIRPKGRELGLKSTELNKGGMLDKLKGAYHKK